jgi:hypothetical protein
MHKIIYSGSNSKISGKEAAAAAKVKALPGEKKGGRNNIFIT